MLVMLAHQHMDKNMVTWESEKMSAECLGKLFIANFQVLGLYQCFTALTLCHPIVRIFCMLHGSSTDHLRQSNRANYKTWKL